MALNRRDFLGGMTCAVCGTSFGGLVCTDANAASQGPAFDGCLISPVAYREATNSWTMSTVADGLFSRNRHMRTTGDSSLDHDLDRALTVIADLFKVNPAFGFYDPSQLKWGQDDAERFVMNAWASPECTDIPGTWGTVAFGSDLFHSEFFEHDSSGTTIVAIVAHEFGHIWQQRSGNMPALRTGYPRKCEINADFLSGYFLGTRKAADPSRKFERAGDLFIRLGKFEDGNPTRTHGDSTERINAAEAGFRVAYVEKRDLDYALKAGLEYVSAS